MRNLPRIALVLMLLVFAGYATTTYLRRIAETDARQIDVPRATLAIGSVLRDSAVTGTSANAPDSGPSRPAARSQQAAGLHPHPDPMLVERRDIGMLPVVGEDGRRPWQVYARPFDRQDARPRIAIVMTGLGVSKTATQRAIDALPGAVTFSFAPYADGLDRWVANGRNAGHEALIDMPMEPFDYPRNDPGPNALLARAPADENLRRLAWALSRTTGYVGVATFMGANLAARPAALRPVLAELQSRGLMILDTRENPLGHIAEIARETGLPFAVNDILIDAEPTAEAIAARLHALEGRARERGAAVALARPLPITIEALVRWLPGLDTRGVALAPLSALAQTRGNGT